LQRRELQFDTGRGTTLVVGVISRPEKAAALTASQGLGNVLAFKSFLLRAMNVASNASPWSSLHKPHAWTGGLMQQFRAAVYGWRLS
jgi:hypothetical protein